MTAGGRIRPARLEDAEGITRCHVGGWKVHYRGILPQTYLDAIDFEERLARRTRALEGDGLPGAVNWVLEEDGEIRGWACTGPARDEDLEAGTQELYAIYLDPARVGQGYGRALMLHCVAEATRRGVRAMTMWVLSGNARAQRFYRAAGFRPDDRVPEASFRDTGAMKLRMVRHLDGADG